MERSFAFAILALATSACSLQSGDRSGSGTVLDAPLFQLVPAQGNMPDFFDCLRSEGAVILSAHRGGPVPGFPENAAETMEQTVSEIPALLEIDVSKTADGVLVLMHDETLDRTTTGEGKLAEKNFDSLSDLRLVDDDGRETSFRIPALDTALAWSEGRTMLALDRKGTTTYEDLVTATEKNSAFGRVVFATYTLDDAAKVYRLAPEAMIVTPLAGPDDAAKLTAAGVNLRNILSWGGTEVPDPARNEALAKLGIESAFAPLGAWTGSWDNRIRMLGDDSLYLRITEGVHLIATDRSRDVARIHPGVTRAKACVA